MVIDMNETKLTMLAQLRDFLAGPGEIEFQPGPDGKRYADIADVL